MQAAGLADLLDFNLTGGQLNSQILLLKRKIQQAGLSDILDVNLNSAQITEQLSKLADEKVSIPVGYDVSKLPKLGAAAEAGGTGSAGGITGLISGLPGILSNPAGLGLAAAGAALVAPIVGQAIGTAIILGLGTALAGIATYGAMQFQPVKKVFTQLANDASDALKQIGVPFRSVMENIFTTADSVLKQLTPVFQTAARTISGPLQVMGDTLLKAFDQPQVKASIEAVGSAFGKLLQAVTPQIPADISQIARAVGEMAAAVGQNPQAFADFVRFLANIATWSVQGIAQLAKAAAWMETNWAAIWSGAGVALLTFAQSVLGVFHTVGNAIFAFMGDTIHWARLAADAVGLHFLDAVDNGFNSARRSFDSFFNHANDLLSGWTRNLLNTPTRVKLQGDITDLQSKLATAKALLDNPDLTKSRRARIEADISQLQAAIARARAELAAINGTTATTYVSTVNIGPGSPPGTKHHAAGGVIGAASGGIRGNLAWVGEQGPELVSLPTGSYVHSNPDSQRIWSDGGSVHVTLELGPNFQRQTGLTAQQLTDIRYEVRTRGGGSVQQAFGHH